MRTKSEALYFYLAILLASFFIMSTDARSEEIPTTTELTTVPIHTVYPNALDAAHCASTGSGKNYKTGNQACDGYYQYCLNHAVVASMFMSAENATHYYCRYVRIDGAPTGVPDYEKPKAQGCSYDETPVAGGCQAATPTCPQGQNWTLTGNVCVRPDCAADEVRNPDNGICEPAVICPHVYLGKEVSTGWGLTTQDISASFDACDSYGCAVTVNKVGRLFGVTLATQTAKSTKCPSPASPPTVLTVTLEQSAPEIVDYQKVAADAAAVDAAHTDYMRDVMARVEAAVTAKKNKLAADKTALDSSIANLQNAFNRMVDAGNAYAANPTVANKNTYEQFKADYAAKAAESRNVLTSTKSDFSSAQNDKKNSDTLNAAAADQQQKINQLEASLSGSSAGFDTAQAEAAKGDKLGLSQAVNSANPAIDALQQQITSLTAALSNSTAKINELSQNVAGLEQTLAGIPLPTAGQGDPPVVDTPPLTDTPVTADTPDFCTEHPTDSTCATKQAIKGGALPAFSGSWYEQKYPDGLSGVLTTQFNAMKATPLFSVLTNIVPTINATAHPGCFTLPVYLMGDQQLCIPQIVMQALGIFILLTAVFAARGIIFGG